MVSAPDARQPDTAGRRRIGVFGGTFDPPHLGHVLAGQWVAEEAGLEEIWFVPANDPWQKSSERTITPAPVRAEMVSRACHVSRTVPVDLVMCDVEVRAGGPSFSADTLATLRAEHPEDEFVLVVGSDAASGLASWHASDWLAVHADFVVYERAGHRAPAPAGFRISPVTIPLVEISSTDIRARVRSGRSVRHLVPGPVEALIAAHGLYRGIEPA